MSEKSDKGAAQSYETEAEALRAKTAKLRALRLAREAEEAASRPAPPARAPRGAAKKRAASKSTGTLADWIKAREAGGHNN
jgi:hypothetical protein